MAGPPSSEEPNGANGAIPPLPPQPTNGISAVDMAPASMSTTALSADEIALYDRQIRLWGAQAQERIRSAHILLISLRALGTEIAKNLTLAGVNSLTIIDDDIVTEEDLGAQYFLRDEDVGKPRAEAAIPRIQELNPRVTIKSDGSLNDLLLKDQTYYEPFECIIACDHDFMTLSMINTASRVAARPFYAAGIHGLYGYIFADLFGHEYVVEREKSNVPTVPGFETLTRTVLGVTDKKEPNGKNLEVVKKQEIYCPLILANSSPLPPDVLSNRRKLKSVPALLPCLRALFDFQRMHGHLPDVHSSQDLGNFTSLATTKSRELLLPPETLRADFLRSFIQNIGAEIVPTAAFVGGRLSEDVINVLGKREQPIQNFALFDGEGLDGRIYCLYTPPPELTMAMAAAGPMDGLGGVMGGDLGLGIGADMSMMYGFGFMPGDLGIDGGMGAMPMDMPMHLSFDQSGAPMLPDMSLNPGFDGTVPGPTPVPDAVSAAAAAAADGDDAGDQAAEATDEEPANGDATNEE